MHLREYPKPIQFLLDIIAQNTNATQCFQPKQMKFPHNSKLIASQGTSRE